MVQPTYYGFASVSADRLQQIRDHFYPSWWMYPTTETKECLQPLYIVACDSERECELARLAQPSFVRAEFLYPPDREEMQSPIDSFRRLMDLAIGTSGPHVRGSLRSFSDFETVSPRATKGSAGLHEQLRPNSGTADRAALDRPDLPHPVIGRLIAAFNILKTATLHPGHAITIDEATGVVTLVDE